MVLGISSEGENNGAHVTGGRWFESIIPNNMGQMPTAGRLACTEIVWVRFPLCPQNIHGCGAMVACRSPKPSMGVRISPPVQTTLSCSEMASHGVLAAGFQVRVLTGQQPPFRTFV